MTQGKLKPIKTVVSLDDITLVDGYFGLIGLNPKSNLETSVLEVPFVVIKTYNNDELPVFTGVELAFGNEPFAQVMTKEGLLFIYHISAIVARFPSPSTLNQEIQERMLMYSTTINLQSKGIITGVN